MYDWVYVQVAVNWANDMKNLSKQRSELSGDGVTKISPKEERPLALYILVLESKI